MKFRVFFLNLPVFLYLDSGKSTPANSGPRQNMEGETVGKLPKQQIKDPQCGCALLG